MVVFGGLDPALAFKNDVWSLSLSGTPSWTRLALVGNSPSARYFHTAVYDPVRDRMLVFGGNISRVVNDVWALSLAGDPAWTQISAAGTAPSPRADHTAIYDPRRDRMVVFAGPTIDGGTSNDAWGLSLQSTPAWTQLRPAGMLPHARVAHSAIYDPVRDGMVVYGGISGGNLADVWSLVWGAPTKASPASAGPAMMLTAAYPNPSAGKVTIDFSLSHAGSTSVRIYDVSGRLVRSLVDSALPAGFGSAQWDRRLPSGALARPGLYFCKLRANDQSSTWRIVLTQ